MRKAFLTSLLILNSCTAASNALNPFYEAPEPEAYLGERNDHALSGNQQKEETARAAFESMSSYRNKNTPQPVDPVLQPAVVRLMWVPDHLNKTGDLVPAHYYYLKVLKDRWAVSDAFELEGQLGPTRSGSSLPFVTGVHK